MRRTKKRTTRRPKKRKSSALVEAEKYIRDLERAAEALRLQNEVYRDRIQELEDARGEDYDA